MPGLGEKRRESIGPDFTLSTRLHVLSWGQLLDA
jgi:hypothetical protein